MALLTIDEEPTQYGQDAERERNEDARHRDALGLVVVQNVVALTNLHFENAAVAFGVVVVAEGTEEAREDASAVLLSALVLVRTRFHALVVVHDPARLAGEAVVLGALAGSTWRFAVYALSVKFHSLGL